MQPPELAYAHLGIACDLACIGVCDLGLDHEVERRAFDEGVGRRRALGEGGAIGSGRSDCGDGGAGPVALKRRYAT